MVDEQQGARGKTSADWLAELELQDEDGDPEVTEPDGETPVEDEQELSDPGVEDESVESDEEAEEIEGETEEPGTPDVFNWDGNPEKLPPPLEYEGVVYDLQDTHKSMLVGHQKKSQKLSEDARQYAAEAERLRQENQQLRTYHQTMVAAENDPMPAPPKNEDPAEWREYDEAKARWVVRDEQRLQARPQIGEQQQQTAAPISDEEAGERRMALLRSQEGWDDSYEQEMFEMAQTDLAWAQALGTDVGAVSFFRFVKKDREAKGFKAEAAKNASQLVRRRAKSADNAVSRSRGTQGKSAADNYAKMNWDNVAD